MVVQRPLDYAPDIGGVFGGSEQQLADYYRSLNRPGQLEDLQSYLREAGTYQPYQFEAIESGEPTYQQQQYEQMGYTPYQDYQQTEYDLMGQYQAPEAYNPYQYTAPEIGELERVSPLASEIWGAKRTEAKEGVAQQYGDIRDRMREEAIRSRGRPEQLAALEASLGIEESKAQRDEARKLAIAEAEQGVGIAQQEQQLALQRGMRQAEFGSEMQERQARELAQTYGMDLDAARYMVDQYAKQQQLQAGESQYGYQTGAEQSRLGQEFEQGERRFGHEQALGEGRYAFETERDRAMREQAMQQWLQEQTATEEEKAYQSRYAQGQDLAQTGLTQYQAQNAADLDYANALLQGQQAQTGIAAQEATYWTNLNQQERDARRREQQAWAQQQQTPTGAPYNPYAPRTAHTNALMQGQQGQRTQSQQQSGPRYASNDGLTASQRGQQTQPYGGRPAAQTTAPKTASYQMPGTGGAGRA